ncbi:shikimate kinase [filamentous cyanobacterium CCP5]|nr:shikimate kinase [filamentous cyanobacterium CCP5]
MNRADFLKGTSLFLIGMMGSGKSTTGRSLAQRLGYRFMDTDQLIEQATGTTVADIFATQGEAAFRALETQVLAQVSAYTRLVVATGGGVVLARQNWSYLHHGAVVWLDPSLELLQQRLAQDTHRPLIQGENGLQKLQTLMNQRQHLYEQADVRVPVEAGDSVEVVGDRVLDLLRQRLRPERQPALPDRDTN